MQLLVIFLAQVDFLSCILKKFKELKISGITVLDSGGVGKETLHFKYTPMIASLHKLWEADCEPSKTLFIVTESEEIALKAIEALKGCVGDINKPETALAFTIPVNNVTGLKSINEL